MALVKYKYKAEMNILFSDKTENIDSTYITEMIIEKNYLEYRMPILYLFVSLDQSIITRLSEEKTTTTIEFSLFKYIFDEEDPLNSDDLITVIQDTFYYFITNNLSKSYDSEERSDEGTSFVNILLGLLPIKAMNDTNNTLDMFIEKADMQSMLLYILSNNNYPILFEPLEYNKSLNNLLIPRLETKNRLLEYLNNNVETFYDTKYTYFIDYDCCYFISRKGNAIKRIGDNINRYDLLIRNYLDEETIDQGQDIKDNICVLYLNEAECSLSDQNIDSKLYTKLATIDSLEGYTDGVTLDSDEYSSEKEMLIRVTNNNTNIVNQIANDIESTDVLVTVNKTDLDTSSLSINKEYYIECDEVYGSEYTGKYLLIRKREIYIRKDEGMTLETILTFTKLKV